MHSEQLTKVKFLECYHDVFEGLGKLHEPYEIRLKADARPVLLEPPRRVLLALHDRHVNLMIWRVQV